MDLIVSNLHVNLTFKFVGEILYKTFKIKSQMLANLIQITVIIYGIN